MRTPQDWTEVACLTAERCKPPKSVLDRAMGMRPAERVAHVYPAGVRRGAIQGVRMLQSANVRLAKEMPPTDVIRIEAWADGIAAAVTLPPKVIFGRDLARGISMIWKRGIERGILFAFERAGLVKGTQ